MSIHLYADDYIKPIKCLINAFKYETYDLLQSVLEYIKCMLKHEPNMIEELYESFIPNLLIDQFDDFSGFIKVKICDLIN